MGNYFFCALNEVMYTNKALDFRFRWLSFCYFSVSHGLLFDDEYGVHAFHIINMWKNIRSFQQSRFLIPITIFMRSSLMYFKDEYLIVYMLISV